MKATFKIVDNYITQENVNSRLKHEFMPKEIESHLANFIVYDLETHNTDRTRPYVFCFYRLSKLAGNDKKVKLTPYKLQKCKKTL